MCASTVIADLHMQLRSCIIDQPMHCEAGEEAERAQGSLAHRSAQIWDRDTQVALPVLWGAAVMAVASAAAAGLVELAARAVTRAAPAGQMAALEATAG